jgi:hypothetical protein
MVGGRDHVRALQAAGQLIDLRWPATHPGLERATDQLQAHWLIWLGALLTLAAATVGASRVPSSWVTGYACWCWPASPMR